MEPLDSQEWGPARYLGLALFLFMAVTGILLTQVGAMRRKQRIRKQVWSNLASEEGVKDLLKTGWVLKGNRMEVYDKSKLGYSDNDSMLIGGGMDTGMFPRVGSEVNVTNTNATTAPLTTTTNTNTTTTSQPPPSTCVVSSSNASSEEENEYPSDRESDNNAMELSSP